VSAPLRFLGLAIIAYVGLRTASSALALEPMAGLAVPPPAGAALLALPPGVPADMGPPPPGYGYAYGMPPQAMAALPQPYAMMPYPVPAMLRAPPASRPWPQEAPYPQPMPEYERQEPGLPDLLPQEAGFTGYEGGAAPALDQWPSIGTTGPMSVPGLQETPSWGKGPAAALGSGRWSLDAWALLRQPRSGLLAIDDPARGLNPGLASAGSLGGS
jgi:hypothetical protein